jgi:hypothetical protein
LVLPRTPSITNLRRYVNPSSFSFLSLLWGIRIWAKMCRSERTVMLIASCWWSSILPWALNADLIVRSGPGPGLSSTWTGCFMGFHHLDYHHNHTLCHYCRVLMWCGSSSDFFWRFRGFFFFPCVLKSRAFNLNIWIQLDYLFAPPMLYKACSTYMTPGFRTKNPVSSSLFSFF